VAKFIGMEDFGFKVLIMCEQVLLLKQNPQVEWKRIKNDANDRDNEEKNVIESGRWIECWRDDGWAMKCMRGIEVVTRQGAVNFY